MGKRKVIVLISAILLFVLFLVYNIFMFLSPDYTLYKDNKKTTTKAFEPVAVPDLAIQDKIVVDGEEKDIYVLELNSHLGFNVRYEGTYFTHSRLSNGAIKITNNVDEKNYVLVEKLQEKDYYKDYNDLNTKEILKDNYLVSYKFLKGNVLTYLKITKSVNITSQDYEEINSRLDYIISSLILTS